METCEECGAEYESDPKHANRKFCSKRCKSRAVSRRAYQRSKEGGLGICTVEGCDRPVRCKKLCYMHYSRQLRTGDVGPVGLVRKGARPCKVHDCDNQAVTSDDLCPTHRRRKKLYGRPDGTFATSRTCSRCDLPAYVGQRSSEFCEEHYDEFVRGEVVAGRIEGTKSPSGYRYVSIRRRSRAVHQIVMEHMLGRPLLPGENIHHRNGIRDDNRPENLELWVKPQMPGRRVEDLVAWVVDRYPDLVQETLSARS